MKQVWLERLFKCSFVLQVVGALNLLPNFEGWWIYFDPSLAIFTFVFNGPVLLALSIYRLVARKDLNKWLSIVAILIAIIGFAFAVMVLLALKKFQ